MCCDSPNLNPTPAAEKVKLTKKSATKKAAPVEPDPTEEAKFVGCYGSESSFIDRNYEGGSTGSCSISYLSKSMLINGTTFNNLS